MPFPNPEGYDKMKFNQDLLIFKAVAIMCYYYSSVILGSGAGGVGGNPKPEEENCNCHRNRLWHSLLMASHSVALKWERKMNPTEVIVILRKVTLFGLL